MGESSAVASAGADGTVGVWDARQSRAAAALPAVGCALYALAWHSDGALILAGYDGVLRSWEPRAARLRVGMPAHSAPVRCLLVHDGVLWSGATDGTVQQWSVEQFLSGKGS